MSRQRRQAPRDVQRLLDEVRRHRDVLGRLGDGQLDAVAVGDRAAPRRDPRAARPAAWPRAPAATRPGPRRARSRAMPRSAAATGRSRTAARSAVREARLWQRHPGLRRGAAGRRRGCGGVGSPRPSPPASVAAGAARRRRRRRRGRRRAAPPRSRPDRPPARVAACRPSAPAARRPWRAPRPTVTDAGGPGDRRVGRCMRPAARAAVGARVARPQVRDVGGLGHDEAALRRRAPGCGRPSSASRPAPSAPRCCARASRRCRPRARCRR